MKRFLCVLLLLSLVLSGCTTIIPDAEQKQYTATFLDLFDTVTTIVGKAESEAAFQEKAQAVKTELERYHKLFDIYKEYDGLNNLKTVNDAAGFGPVTVDQVIIDLLLDCKTYCDATDGKVNAAMGAVLQLWHEARSDSIDDPANAYLPDQEDLAAAAQHTDMNTVIIDQAASTVFISDPRGCHRQGLGHPARCRNCAEGLAHQCRRQCLRHRPQG